MVGARLFQGDRLVGETTRALIPRDIFPGEEFWVEHKLDLAPDGHFRIVIDLVCDEISWFGDRGSPFVSFEV